MTPSGLEYSDSPLFVYGVQTAGGTMLRVSNNGMSRDVALPRTAGGAAVGRFTAVGNAFVVPFFDANRDMGVAIWHL
jgi:hypothetical protein